MDGDVESGLGVIRHLPGEALLPLGLVAAAGSSVSGRDHSHVPKDGRPDDSTSRMPDSLPRAMGLLEQLTRLVTTGERDDRRLPRLFPPYCRLGRYKLQLKMTENLEIIRRERKISFADYTLARTGYRISTDVAILLYGDLIDRDGQTAGYIRHEIVLDECRKIIVFDESYFDAGVEDGLLENLMTTILEPLYDFYGVEMVIVGARGRHGVEVARAGYNWDELLFETSVYRVGRNLRRMNLTPGDARKVVEALAPFEKINSERMHDLPAPSVLVSLTGEDDELGARLLGGRIPGQPGDIDVVWWGRKSPQAPRIAFHALMQSEAARLLEADPNDAHEIGKQFKGSIREWYDRHHGDGGKAEYDSVRSWRGLIFSYATTKIFDKTLRRLEERIDGGKSLEALLEAAVRENREVSEFGSAQNNWTREKLEPIRKYLECMSAILAPVFEEFMRECENGGSLQRFGEALEAATKTSPAVLDRWYERFIHETDGRSWERAYSRDEFARQLAGSGRANLKSSILAVAFTGADFAYPFHFVAYDMNAEEKLQLYWDFIPHPGLSGLSFWSRRQLNKLFAPFWMEVYSPSPRLRVIKDNAFAAFGIGIDDVGDPMVLRSALYRRERPRSPRRCPAPNIPLAAEIVLRLTGHVAPSTLWKPYPGLFIDGGIPAGEVPVDAAINDTCLESVNVQPVAGPSVVGATREAADDRSGGGGAGTSGPAVSSCPFSG